MNHFKECITDSPVLQTAMDATILRKIVDFCYTEKVCFEGVSQACTLLKFAMEYGITDLVVECRAYLNARAPPPSPQPSIVTQKLIIYSEDGLGAAMLESINGEWVELPEIAGSQNYPSHLTSVAYCGDDCVVVSGGLVGKVSRKVSRVVCACV